MSSTCLATAADDFVWHHHVQSENTRVTVLMVTDSLFFQEEASIKLKGWILIFNFGDNSNPHILTKKMPLTNNNNKHIVSMRSQHFKGLFF